MIDSGAGDATWDRPSHAFGLFLRGYTVRTAVPTAVVVGTILSAVNEGAVLVGGHPGVGTWVQISINYLVPFLVASVGYIAARRRSHHTHGDSSPPSEC